MPHTPLLRHLTRPVRGGAVAVLIVFALLLSLAANAGLMGLPLSLIITSWFFKYAYILFDHTHRGYDEPPTLDIQMLNPLDEQRPLAQLVILALIYVAVKFAYNSIGHTAGDALGVFALLLLPASVAVLGLEGNILKAAYPVALVRMVIGLGPLYLAILVLITGYFGFMTLLDRWALWLPLRIAFDMFCILSVFSILGGALYERRHELELDTWVSPEQTKELERQEELRQSEREVTAAYGQMRAGSHTQSWQTLQTWLVQHDNNPQYYRWLCARVVTWNDPRYITRLTEDYVDRLLVLKRTGEALDAVTQRLKLDPNFRPKTAAATLHIAQIAAVSGNTHGVARRLLADFPTRFPGDPHIEAAATLNQHVTA